MGVFNPEDFLIEREDDQDLIQHQKEIDNFQITTQIDNYLYLDETQRKFALPKLSFTGKVKDMDIFNYDDIVDFELLEDNKSISNGNIGRAVVGGVLFGGVGAIVGSTTGRKKKEICKKLQIKITVNDISNPVVYIDLITAEVKKNSFLYETTFSKAQEILSLLSIICQENSKENSDLTSTVSVADEIKKYKELLDMGAITLDEFEKKKKDLLNL